MDVILLTFGLVLLMAIADAWLQRGA